MGQAEATAAEDYVRQEKGRAARAELKQKDAGVSELEGAMAFLNSVIGEQGDVIEMLRMRVQPILHAEKDTMVTGDVPAMVDERSEHVRRVSNYADNVRSHTEALQAILDRLDV